MITSAVVVGVAVLWLGWHTADVGAQATPGAVGGPASVLVIVDPGHGGDDPGAMGPGGTEEKALTLSVAQRLRALLQSRPGFRALLTREDDRRLTADQRATFSNGAGGQVFISLHANASPSPTTSGLEVGSLLVATDSPLRDAEGENRVPLLPVASGLPRRVAVVRWNRAQAPHHALSAMLAQDLGRRFAELGRLGPRGVYRASLRPLVAVAAPAVLVELGYLSNNDEESALVGDERQGAVVQAIAQALEAVTLAVTR
jgi:N-acetylmuramoyl-L-alanine amidase